MLSALFSRFVSSIGMVFRVIRSFALRQVAGLSARIKRLTSASRYAVKALPKAISAVASVGKKPTRREDYFETKRMYIAKSFVIAVILAIIAISALAFFVLRPWLISRYFTAHFFRENAAVESYSGKVALYYDKEKSKLFFKGHMENGVIGGEGEEFDENGDVVYSGQWENGIYNGSGAMYSDGEIVYRGGFSDGLYSAEGREYSAGRLVFRGEFADGLRNGQGTVFSGEGVTIEALFEDGGIRGAARIYSGGFLVYEGMISNERPWGFGALYSPRSGLELYRGEFINGRPSGIEMLGAGVADSATLFGGSLPESRAGDTYFVYENAGAGFAMFYPKRVSEGEPKCVMVVMYEPEEAEIPWSAPPWQNTAEYEESEQEVPPREDSIHEYAAYLYNVGYGQYHRTKYTLEGGDVILT
ncbi:MAG: hypothetical protein LBH17_07335, partial [Oscillospiraceae bacterium]|nr:hypothetical protein [Oscillospiraceae bacterium]